MPSATKSVDLAPAELKPTLSPSALGHYETCGRRGQFYQSKLFETKIGMGLAQGSAWHTGMETFGAARRYYGNSLVRMMPPDLLYQRLLSIMVGAFDEMAMQGNFVWQDGETPTEAHENLARMLLVYTNADPSVRWQDPQDSVKVDAVELELVSDFGAPHHVFRGFIDTVLRHPEYGTIGVDYKTAGRAWGGDKALGDPRKLIQAPLYAEAWLRETGEAMDWFVYDVMTVAGRFQRVWVNTTPEVRAPFLQRWLETSLQIHHHQTLNMNMPTNPSSFLCSAKYCDFWEVCEMGAPLELRIGVTPDGQ